MSRTILWTSRWNKSDFWVKMTKFLARKDSDSKFPYFKMTWTWSPGLYIWGTDRYKSRKIIYSRPRKLVLIYFGFHQTVNEALVTPFRFINTGYGLKNDRFTSDLPQFVPIINCHNNEWFMLNNSDKVWPSLTASDLDLTSDLWSRQMTKAHSEWIGLKSEKKSKYTPGDNAKTRQVIQNSRSPISLNFISRTIGKSKMTDKSCIKSSGVLRTPNLNSIEFTERFKPKNR